MNDNKKTMLNYLLASQLHTLLLDKNLQVLNTEDFKIIFSKTQLIGYSEGNKLFIKPEYLKGGKFWNDIIEMEIQLVRKQYQLTEPQAIEENEGGDIKTKRLTEILKEVNELDQPELIEELMEEAVNLVEEDIPAHQKIIAEISIKAAEKMKLVSPDEIAVLQEFTKRFAEINDNKDKYSPEGLLKELEHLVNWAGEQNVNIPEYDQQVNQLKQMFEVLKSETEAEFKKKLVTGAEQKKVSPTIKKPDNTGKEKGTDLLKSHPVRKNIEEQAAQKSKLK